jgi:hypothetical protein
MKTVRLMLLLALALLALLGPLPRAARACPS